jgi:hypothetical protein
MQPNGDGAAAEVLGESVVVVPPVLPVATLVAVRSGTLERCELQISRVWEGPDADRTVSRKRRALAVSSKWNGTTKPTIISANRDPRRVINGDGITSVAASFL